jgi:DNA-binding LytR/AlgR family response regulator
MVIEMSEEKSRLRISIIEDEQDNLIIYKDFLIGRGHEIVSISLNAENVLHNFVKNSPDIFLLDYRIPGNKSGIDVAIEILTVYPLFPILFISAYDNLRNDMLNYTIFRDKKIDILTKPVHLEEIEKAMLKLVN